VALCTGLTDCATAPLVGKQAEGAKLSHYDNSCQNSRLTGHKHRLALELRNPTRIPRLQNFEWTAPFSHEGQNGVDRDHRVRNRHSDNKKFCNDLNEPKTPKCQNGR
jgi:hypothetical protein